MNAAKGAAHPVACPPWAGGQSVTCIAMPCGSATARMLPAVSVLVVTLVGGIGMLLMTCSLMLAKLMVPFMNGDPSAFTTTPVMVHIGIAPGVGVAVGVLCAWTPIAPKRRHSPIAASIIRRLNPQKIRTPLNHAINAWSLPTWAGLWR